jgi:hypothetical protein
MNERKKPAPQPDDLRKFSCQSCDYTGFDIQESFSGTPSTRCIWCAKYPKPKSKAAKASEINGSDTAENT